MLFGKTRKAPGALDPAVIVPPLGCKICYGHSRYEGVKKWVVLDPVLMAG